jgi:hypothetical protein
MGRTVGSMNTIGWLLESKTEYQATAEQVAKIQEINKKFEAETASLRAELQKIRDEGMGGGDRQAVMQKMRPLREEMRTKDEAAVAEAMKLLNAEQQKTVNEMLAKRREEMRNRMRNRGPGRQ